MSEALDTIRGVGWVVQVQQDDGQWVSWTQFKQPEPATLLAQRLLDNERHGFIAARVQRVDWTEVKRFAKDHPVEDGEAKHE
jgi:hypothetical protein